MTETTDWNELCAETIGDFRLTALPTPLPLPALPVAVPQFLEKSKDPEASIKELSQLIETDAGLTLELLRHVLDGRLLRGECKSAWAPRNPNRQLTSLQHREASKVSPKFC